MHFKKIRLEVSLEVYVSYPQASTTDYFWKSFIFLTAVLSTLSLKESF